MSGWGKKRTTVYLDQRTLRVLAREGSTPDLNDALKEFAEELEDAARWMEGKIFSNEWSYLLRLYDLLCELFGPRVADRPGTLLGNLTTKRTDPRMTEAVAEIGGLPGILDLANRLGSFGRIEMLAVMRSLSWAHRARVTLPDGEQWWLVSARLFATVEAEPDGPEVDGPVENRKKED